MLDICFGGRRKFCGGSYVDFGKYQKKICLDWIISSTAATLYIFKGIFFLEEEGGGGCKMGCSSVPEPGVITTL